ncbi:LOW QUALITY PROTEIN: ankyrin repeat domain-containing protein 53 [Myripristis murdjan]|uniref:LOW QUALITY PROTEIN: ankyrin repeat domain-containing protein 53 n=1 Tax=Myripristis murdjan TaxID=586833 RepID=UPI001176366B|nr:LOW QUALITY PROTEIN: ankyrin repeat domain-containing protein 53-like [Myripristis murdjan]
MANKVSRTAAPAGGSRFLAAAAGDPQQLGLRLQAGSHPHLDREVALHVACLHGSWPCVELLVERRLVEINSSGPHGRRPVHVVLSSQSAPNSSACLRYLLEHGADINVPTDAGQTPLHLAASEGLLDCVERCWCRAGGGRAGTDGHGTTALDLARIYCHRKYLKNCMWQQKRRKKWGEEASPDARSGPCGNGQTESHQKNKPLTGEQMAEWANKKGLPVLKEFSPKVLLSQYHTQCLLSGQDGSGLKHVKGPNKPQPGGPPEDMNLSTCPAKSPAASVPRLQLEKPQTDPDLRDVITLWSSSSGAPQYCTKWDSTPRAAPDLPLDILKRLLFPLAFPSRIASPWQFQPQDILQLPHLGRPQGQSASPWTEVAMHLAEVLEPGHY